jgi:hypothetical protein
VAKFTGKGAEFLVSDGGTPAAYTPVGQVSEIGDVSVTADEVEVTTLDAGDYRDYIQGFKDPGECELTVVFDPAMADQGTDPDGLLGLFASGEVRDCAIRWNSSGTGGEAFGTFQAFIRDMTFNALNPDDPQTITPLFRLKSPITLVDTLPTTLGGREPGKSDAVREAEAALERARKADRAHAAERTRTGRPGAEQEMEQAA